MKIFYYLFWIPAGAGLAIAIFFTQYWSVKAVHPGKERLSKRLIIGGALLRLLLIGLIFFFALSSSIFELLIVFLSFMIVRLLILNNFAKRWNTLPDQIN